MSFALPPNVDRSAFRRGEYVAYDPRGFTWHVRKCASEWLAQPAPNNPARSLGVTINGSTLRAVAQSITNRQPARIVEPF